MKDKNILIIGGTGTWGRALLEQLLKTEVSQIKVLARNEHNLVSLRRQFPDKRVLPILGDIRDRTHLTRACEGADVLFHLAALKHVPVCEQMPTEAILTNVTGTQNVIDCATLCGVKKVVYTSTDKAVSPNCTYGCTKLLGEKLILSADARGGDTRFIVFRSGNLLGSSGSVIPLFKDQIEQSMNISLTDTRMNRFFITPSKAAEQLLETALRGEGGEVFLPRMDSLLIRDIAKYLLQKNGLDEDRINVTGIRPGEALSEAMISATESRRLFQQSDELFALIGPDSRVQDRGTLMKAESYMAHSGDAVLPYELASAFLAAAGV